MFSIITKVYAQSLSQEDFGVSGRVGYIYNFYNFFVWGFNMCIYIGGGLTAIGIIWSFSSMALKFLQEPDTDTFTIVRGASTKALMFGVIGVLLLGLGSLFKLVGDALGTPIEFAIPTELKFNP